MTSKLDKILKWLWLVNGIALLGLMTVLGYFLAREVIRERRPRTQAVDITETEGPTLSPRAVRYDPPARVFGSSSSLITVRYGRAFQPATSHLSSSKSDSYRSWLGPVVNVMFLNVENNSEHLLLDRPAYIDNLSYPRSEDDLHQAWISYEIALEDSNGDGKLDEHDDATLFVSDLNGHNFRRILPDGLIVKWHGAHAEGAQILIFALDRTGFEPQVTDDQLPQRALLFDVETGDTTPYATLNELARTAGEALAQ